MADIKQESAEDISAVGSDPEAFERFYRAHADLVGRIIARRVSDPHTVADLTSEVFLAVITSAHTYRPERGSVAGWLHGVARHVIARESKRQAREQNAAWRAGGRRTLGTEDVERIEDRADAEAAARRTYEALSGMPESTRQLIELVAVDGLSVTEAAAAVGLTPLVARARMFRARRRLQALTRHPVPTLAQQLIEGAS
ncbi:MULTISPECIES: RNA polymerase sigma factor [Micromonospora]|uniref:RNA polymerase subunit sigma n=1 Tax=Micromonospora tulbaghiae TaxID=479978 RepID=A0A386WQ32_9ACTN|nr:sigma-70 family RNA polymerase sigma factor [Micromonospora tulbaghiae]AYF30546.1 RNA polymerase subunit sigma [Micromonospora tulbaghiae]